VKQVRHQVTFLRLCLVDLEARLVDGRRKAVVAVVRVGGLVASIDLDVGDGPLVDESVSDVFGIAAPDLRRKLQLPVAPVIEVDVQQQGRRYAAEVFEVEEVEISSSSMACSKTRFSQGSSRE
jgi:hypothetical protein